MRVCWDSCRSGSSIGSGEVGVQYPEEVGGRSMVPKRGEGGMLTGGVSGSSSIMALLAGSKKWTLVGVNGAIAVVRAKAADAGARGSDGSGGRR